MQLVTRAACRLGKSLGTSSPWLRPEFASLQHVPCQAVTPQQEQRRHGGAATFETVTQSTDVLSHFVGHWTQYRYENLRNFLINAGIARPLYERYTNRQHRIIYRRLPNGDLEAEESFIDSNRRYAFTIVLDHEYDHGEVGIPLISMYYVDGNLLQERIRSYMGPPLLITNVHEVKKNEMTITSRAGDEVFTRYFKRMKQQK